MNEFWQLCQLKEEEKTYLNKSKKDCETIRAKAARAYMYEEIDWPRCGPQNPSTSKYSTRSLFFCVTRQTIRDNMMASIRQRQHSSHTKRL
jgi:hypothetical protein